MQHFPLYQYGWLQGATLVDLPNHSPGRICRATVVVPNEVHDPIPFCLQSRQSILRLNKGPNGVHQCLVLEIMGASAASLVGSLPENRSERWRVTQRYPKAVAKTILLHALKGLSFLHGNGIVHGDIQPGNMLFSIASLEDTEQQELEQDITESARPVLRIDGKTDRWAPSKLYERQSLHNCVQLGPDLCVKLSDFGAAFFSASPPTSTITPSGLRAPELILKRPFNESIDIWSFGCLIYEFLTGQQLFTVMNLFFYDDYPDDDHLVQLNDKIGQLPDDIMKDWKGAKTWYGPNHEQLCPFGEYKPYESLQVRFAKHKHPDIGNEEAEVICRLISSILVYDPAKRPTAEELLQHPWFSECMCTVETAR